MVRIKYRYLLISFLYPGDDKKFNDNNVPWTVRFRRPTSDKLGNRVLMDLMRRALEELFGDYGAGMVAPGLIVKYLSAATSTAIIRAPRAHYRMLWAALTSVTELPSGEKCTIQVIRVSGTIRKSEEAAIRQARRCIILAQGGAAALLPKDTTMTDSIEDDDLDLDEDD